MPTQVTITLDAVDVFQIIDAVNSRAEAWENTEALLNGAYDGEEFFVPEECHKPEEAAGIARHFRDIAALLEAQLPAP